MTQPQVKADTYFDDTYVSLERLISYFYQIDLIRKSRPKSVLFIGVGDGMVPAFLRNHVDSVTTVDIDPDLKPDVTGDIRALPFPDAAFDLVCAFEVLEHLPFDESKKALGELARVSRGDVLVSVPHRRTGFELVLKFPFIRTLTGKTYLNLPLLVPIRFPGFAVSGQHYWEIDGRTTRLKDARAMFESSCRIVAEYTPVMDSYHRFFVLKKRAAAVPA
jgi:ubiquinone/menaquinone biosynthesis C-methylase UbiE